MTGEELYTEYAAQCALIPAATRKHEALAAWPFVETDVKRMWTRLASKLEWGAGEE